MTNTASGITGLLPAPTWRGWMAITHEVMEVQEVQEGRPDIVYCCCVLLYAHCSTLLPVCAFCLVMMKGNSFIWFQNPDHMKSLHHYFSNPAYANPYRRAVNVYRVSKHTHCPFHWLFLHKQTHKKKSLKHHISLWLNYRLSVSQTWNWIPTPACKAPPSDIKPICRIRHRTTTR